VTLSTTRSLDLAPVRVNLALRFVVVSICAASAGAHVALVPEHLDALGLATSAAEVVAALAATTLITRKEPQ
jgi:hypothetical protein